MDFLKKAKNAAKDAESLNSSFKKMGFDAGSYFKKDEKSASASTAPSTAQSAAPTESSAAASTPPPASTPASTTADVAAPPVPVNTAEGAHTGKLPLAVRKSVRDNWEANKAENDGELSKILGTPWTSFVDVPGVYSYAVHQDTAQRNPGGVINTYFTGANSRIKEFVSKFGEDGKNEINRLAYRHTITLEPTSDKSISYGSAAVVDGRLVILFRDNQLCVNNTYVMENIGEVVNKAGAGGGAGSGPAVKLSMNARQSIKKDYEDKIEEPLGLARKYLQEPSFNFDPNFEANYAFMHAFAQTLDYDDYDDRNKLRKDWAEIIGAATFEYFDGFVRRLKDKNFHKDEMLREGFNESVENHVVKLIVQEKIPKNYSSIDIENGVLNIRVTPEWWWTNASNTCDDIIDLL